MSPALLQQPNEGEAPLSSSVDNLLVSIAALERCFASALSCAALDIVCFLLEGLRQDPRVIHAQSAASGENGGEVANGVFTGSVTASRLPSTQQSRRADTANRCR